MTIYPQYVLKRDGRIVPFDIDKIRLALLNASRVTGEFDEAEAIRLSTLISSRLQDDLTSSIGQIQDQQPPYSQQSYHCDLTPTIEQIQDQAEEALLQYHYLKTARAYIAYRSQHARLRSDVRTVVDVESSINVYLDRSYVRAVDDVESSINEYQDRSDVRTVVDVESSINEYLDQSDWRVNANANQGWSLGGLILNTSGKMIANYWLSHVYPPAIGEAHRSGAMHIHDLDMLSGYCAGWSLRRLLQEGFNGVPGKVEAKPPKHFSAAIGQIVNFLGTLQNEWAGAQAFSSFDTYMAAFIRADNLQYRQVKQYIQELIYNLNVPSRWGTQTPFTNLTFDWICPEDLREQIPYVGGKEMPFSYGDLHAEMDMINRAYIEVMMEGDALGRVFTFPIPTYNITKDFAWDHPNTDLLFEMTAKYGLPYFQNFLNSDLEPHMVRSMCCRLQLDLRELLKRGNGLFGSAEQTGSLGVVTINCARIGYEFKGNEAGLLARVDQLMDLAKQSLEIKRKLIGRLIDGGLYPYTKRYLGTLRNHFSTLGVNGINEMIRNFSDDQDDISSEAGYALAIRLLDHIRAKMSAFQEETGHLYNLEATPAEGTTYRFAKEDKKFYPDILQAGTVEQPFYTNSSQLPVGFTDDPFEALGRQQELQRKYTGGTVLHLYMNEAISSPAACKALVKKALTNYRLPYITITPTFSICPKHGYLSGHHEFCPKCDGELLAKKCCVLG